MKDFELIGKKDISRICNCSDYRARQIKSEMLDYFKIESKRLMYYHLKIFFKEVYRVII